MDNTASAKAVCWVMGMVSAVVEPELWKSDKKCEVVGKR